METIKVCKSYNVLGRGIVYSQYPASDIYDEITIKIPEGFEAYENAAGEIVVKKENGSAYLLGEILTRANNSDKPIFRWIEDFGKYHSAKVEIVEE